MGKRKTTGLKLNRETVRSLSASRLGAAAGGWIGKTADPDGCPDMSATRCKTNGCATCGCPTLYVSCGDNTCLAGTCTCNTIKL